MVISIGQLSGWAIAALWRRRFAVLGLMLAWLALDGFLLGYLSTFHPTLWLVLPRVVVPFLDREWLLTDWFQILMLLPQHYVRDLIRAVFVVLLLRALLAAPPGGGGQSRAGLIVPILLILVFEIAWTTVLFPADHGLALVVSRAAIDGSVDSAGLGIASALVRGLIFAGYALAMSRLCFVFPNAAVEGALRPTRSWRETGGLAAKLFLLFLAIPIPFVVLRSLLMMLILQYDFTLETHRYLQLCLLVLDSVQVIPAAIVTLAVVAVAYVAATGHAAAVISGGARTPRQLAEAFD